MVKKKDNSSDPKAVPAKSDGPQNGWSGAPLKVLQQVEVQVCRTDIRVNSLKGREYAAKSRDEEDTHIAARMAFLFVSRVFEIVRSHPDVASAPRYNQLEGHLKEEGHPFRKVRLSDCLEGKTKNRADVGQARSCLKYLMLGSAVVAKVKDMTPDDVERLVRDGYPVGRAPAGEKDLTPEEVQKVGVWRRVDEFVFREDSDAEGPRFLLHARRASPDPHTATELRSEVERIARKAEYRLAGRAELVWAIGGTPFPRPDLAQQLPEAVALALSSGVDVTFVYTDALPGGCGLGARTADPSRTIADLERNTTAGRRKITHIHVGDDGDWAPGDWAFLSPCFQFVYLRATAFEAEEVLYILRGPDSAGTSGKVPLAVRANRFEREAFVNWLTTIRRKVAVG